MCLVLHMPQAPSQRAPSRTQVSAADTASKELQKQNAEGKLFPELSGG